MPTCIEALISAHTERDVIRKNHVEINIDLGTNYTWVLKVVFDGVESVI